MYKGLYFFTLACLIVLTGGIVNGNFEGKQGVSQSCIDAFKTQDAMYASLGESFKTAFTATPEEQKAASDKLTADANVSADLRAKCVGEK